MIGLALSVAAMVAASDRPPERDYGRECLALVMFTEQNEASPDGMGLVGHTLLNRLADPRYPKNICDVANQPGQFEGMTKYRPPRDPARDQPRRWAYAWALARSLLDMSWELPGQCDSPSPITHFHHGPRPAWARTMRLVCSVDGQEFYSEKP